MWISSTTIQDQTRREVFSHKRTKYQGTMQSWQPNMTFNQFKKKTLPNLWWGFKKRKSSAKIISFVSCEYLWGDICDTKAVVRGEIAIVQHYTTLLNKIAVTLQPTCLLNGKLKKNICENINIFWIIRLYLLLYLEVFEKLWNIWRET